MSFKQLILQRLEGKPEGKLYVNSEVNSEPQKTPESLPQNNAHTLIKVTLIEQNCQGCQYYDMGPTPDGKGVIQWCGPWKHSNKDQHWFNINELSVCPLDIKRRMQR